MNDFSVAFDHVGETVVLCPGGELDIATASELEHTLERVLGGGRAVAVDLSQVTFADCAGLSPLRRAIEEGGRRGTSVRLFAARPPVERVLRLTGLSPVIGVCDGGGVSLG